MLALLLVGSLLITASSVGYFDADTVPPFVIEKLPLRFEALWLASLRVHVVSASLALPLCVALMTRSLQRRALWHRWLGRITGILLLFALVPSGVVLAFDAKGGTLVTIGFLLSAALVAYWSVHAVRAARRRDLASHAHAMRHVVGQMSVAVTSRALMVGLDILGLDPDFSYAAALWLPVVGTAIALELIGWHSIDVSAVAGGTPVRCLRWLLSCVLLSALHASTASADEPSLAAWAMNRVQLEVVRAIDIRDSRSSRFSRARPVPRQRRVRIVRASTVRDQLGRQFIRFAIDVRFGASNWKTDDVVGCIYTPAGDVYVKSGGVYRPAAFLEGKRVAVVPGACRAASARDPHS